MKTFGGKKGVLRKNLKKLNENVFRNGLNLNLGDQNEVNSYLGV